MSLSSSFSQIYDKTNAWSLKHNNPNTLEIIEPNSIELSPTDPTYPKTHKLILSCPGREIIGYGNRLVQGITHTTTGRSTILEDKDCDGIAIIESNGKVELVFAELKSTFSIQELTYATYQMLNSFLKMHSMFALCDEYNIDNVNVSFILACQNYKDEKQEATVAEIASESQRANIEGFKGEVLGSIISGSRYCDIKLSKIGQIDKEFNKHDEVPHYLNKYPFAQSIKDKKVRIYLALSDTFGNPECKITLH